MGHDTTLDTFSFKSRLSEKELNARWSDFLKNQPKEIRYRLEIYDFSSDPINGNESFMHYLEMDDFYGKHYEMDNLSEFVSTVIAPGEYMIIQDDDPEAYLVVKGKTYPIDYIRTVCGLPLDDFVKNTLKKEVAED